MLIKPSLQRKLQRAAQAALFVLVCQLAGLLGALTTVTGTSGWYQALAKPVFNPPGWVFGPVWTLLYTLMGIAAYLVWRQDWERHEVKRALAFFTAQLVLNAVWTPIFFGAHWIGGALAVIGALVVVLALTIRRFFALSRTAGWLLVPYLAWVLFAAVLNASIWLMN